MGTKEERKGQEGITKIRKARKRERKKEYEKKIK